MAEKVIIVICVKNPIDYVSKINRIYNLNKKKLLNRQVKKI